MTELGQAEAAAFIRGVRARSRQPDAFITHLEGQGFHFAEERATAFLYGAPAMLPDGSPGGFSANVLGILPTSTPISPHDESHRAAAVSIHHGGFALAASVTVLHRPYRVTEFTLYELDTRNVPGPDTAGQQQPARVSIVTRVVSAEELQALTPEEIAGKLGQPPQNPALWDAGMATPDSARQAELVAATLQRLLTDTVAESTYDRGAVRELLRQTPLAQTFAVANFGRFNNLFRKINLCTSTSTSCQACSSSSTSSSKSGLTDIEVIVTAT
jgi:hypothetical protein